jgi:outer membrane protein W
MTKNREMQKKDLVSDQLLPMIWQHYLFTRTASYIQPYIGLVYNGTAGKCNISNGYDD